MELKKFRNKYNLELIPASHENILLGTLVWDPLIGKPKFDHPGMPEHIFNAFLDADIVSRQNWTKGIKDLEQKFELKNVLSFHFGNDFLHFRARTAQRSCRGNNQ